MLLAAAAAAAGVLGVTVGGGVDGGVGGGVAARVFAAASLLVILVFVSGMVCSVSTVSWSCRKFFSENSRRRFFPEH